MKDDSLDTSDAVIQGYNESSSLGTLSYDSLAGDWTYTFLFSGATVPGDARTITNAVSSDGVVSLPNVVEWDSTLTTRVGIEAREVEADGTTRPVAAAVAVTTAMSSRRTSRATSSRATRPA